MIGTTVSHYKILEKLGEGGMGVVYKAHDTKLDRDVALKFLPQQITVSDEDKARFLQEAKAISALNHPNIATIYDVDEEVGPASAGASAPARPGELREAGGGRQKFLVLEYIPGGTLKSKLKQLKSEDREFALSEALEYGIQAAEALAHAHRHQIVHRDVKTDNLMLTEEGRVKLTDFGLAKLRGSLQVTKTGTTVGTAAYMSPEQIRGEEIDQRSDIFSFGVMLYELLTSRLPFRGEFETALNYSILNEDPPSVKSLRKDCPQALERIIDRCLEKERTKRYQNAEEVVDALKEVRQGLSSPVKVVKNAKKLALFAGGGILVLVVILLILFFWPSKQAAGIGKSVAVLPFVNMSSDQENEYLSDGLTEDLCTALSQVKGLRVPARTSCFAFKGKTEDVRKIGEQLNVASVLEGSVSRAGNQLRITAQLIDVSNGFHLWARNYDREMGNILEMRSDIAQQVVAALKVQLGIEESRALGKKPTENAEAHDLYLRGRFYYNQYSWDGLQRALRCYRQSIEKDPAYIDPYIGISLTYDALSDVYLPPSEALLEGKAAAQKALEIDSLSGEAHGALGIILTLYEWKVPEGKKELRRALQLSPNSSDILTYSCMCAAVCNDMNAALDQVDRAIALDPLSAAASWSKEFILYLARRYDDAIQQHRRTAELDSTFLYWDHTVAASYREKGMFREAVGEYLRINSPHPLYGLAVTYARMGRKGDARRIANELEKASKRSYVSPDHIAAIYANLNERDKAFEWLEKAYEARSSSMAGFQLFPEYDPIRSDPRFIALLKKVGVEQ